MKGYGKRAFSRADRVGALMRNVISDILRKEIKDPRLSLTTITDVTVSRDLKHAKAFFSIRGDSRKQIAETEEGFRRALGFIKKRLAEEVELRYMPELTFVHDGSFDYAARIGDVLRSVVPPEDAGADGETDQENGG